MKIQDLKKGEYFTVKPIAEPKESQVYVYDGYNRHTKKYVALKFNDFCVFREFKKDTEIYTDFIF